MSVFSREESDLLDRIAIDTELNRLAPPDRAAIVLRVAYAIPDDYAGLWPAYHPEIGHYVGSKYYGKPISETRIQHRITAILAKWKRRHHTLPHAPPTPVLHVTPPVPRAPSEAPHQSPASPFPPLRRAA